MALIAALQQEVNRGISRKKSFKKLFEDLKRKSESKVDDYFRQTHKEVFDELDCLTCANCCKTTSPIFIDKDVSRIAEHLKVTEEVFVKQYLKKDHENDWVLQKSPCTFLNDDNTCSIYDVRPRACREYPHTDRKHVTGIASLTVKNAEICPAVVRILEKVEDALNKRRL